MDVDFEINKSVKVDIEIGQYITTDISFKKTVEVSKENVGEVHRVYDERFSPKIYDDKGEKLTKAQFRTYLLTLYEEIRYQWEELEDLFEERKY